MTNVIKRNGKKERFDADKVRGSIKKAFVDAGISVAQNREKIEAITGDVVKAAKGKAQIRTKSIKQMVLKGLGKTKKAAVTAWKRFDKRYK